MENNHFWLKGGHSSQELFHAIGTPVQYEAGTCLFTQGDITDYFYYLVEGLVRIVVY